MELGQRLRQARLDAGLSQRELCGEQITRNMLSQIENGTAQPSMETLTYLARKLGKPVSFFLDDQPPSPNQELMEQARAAFSAENYGQTLSLLTQYVPDDPVFDWEYYLLEAQSCIELAAIAIQKNHSAHAAQLLERAARAGEKTPYYNEATRRQRLLLLCNVSNDTVSLPPDDEALLVRASVSISEGNFDRALQYLDAAEDKSSSKWNFLRGKALVAQERFSEAVSHLKNAEEDHPDECTAMLEQSYREMEDYKNAYFYACKLRAKEGKSPR
ncbi:MAG: helix-turn-helix domain-containing protein [Oscillospiraceae bacterium]|nr:helix-turn-helix domain-containing protein [Oscillospiraceae bacterium]